jgi:hypothetical protein
MFMAESLGFQMGRAGLGSSVSGGALGCLLLDALAG